MFGIFDLGVEIKDYEPNASGKLSLILKGKIRSDFHLRDIISARLSYSAPSSSEVLTNGFKSNLEHLALIELDPCRTLKQHN